MAQNGEHYQMGLSSIILFVRHTMETPLALGVMSFLLVFVPIIGMWAVHKYGWQHWEPFSRNHK